MKYLSGWHDHTKLSFYLKHTAEDSTFFFLEFFFNNKKKNKLKLEVIKAFMYENIKSFNKNQYKT